MDLVTVLNWWIVGNFFFFDFVFESCEMLNIVQPWPELLIWICSIADNLKLSLEFYIKKFCVAYINCMDANFTYMVSNCCSYKILCHSCCVDKNFMWHETVVQIRIMWQTVIVLRIFCGLQRLSKQNYFICCATVALTLLHEYVIFFTTKMIHK